MRLRHSALALALPLLLVLTALPARAQTSPACNRFPNFPCKVEDDTIDANWTFAATRLLDLSAGRLRAPGSDTPPATCTPPEIYVDMNGGAGSRLLLCTATNTWTGMDDAGGGTAHDLLSATHTDTVAAAPTRGAVIVGNATPAWARLTVGVAGTVLGSDGTDATWTAISASHIGAGDLANVLVWNESCTASPCQLANAPRTADTALVVHSTLVLRRVASCGGVNEYTLSDDTITFCGDAPSAAPDNALVTYER